MVRILHSVSEKRAHIVYGRKSKSRVLKSFLPPDSSMQVPAPRGQDSRDGSDPDAAANGGDESSPLGENSENDTDEAKFDE